MVCYYMFIAQGILAEGPNSLPVVDMATLLRGFQLTGPNITRQVIGPLRTLFSHRKKRGSGICRKAGCLHMVGRWWTWQLGVVC